MLSSRSARVVGEVNATAPHFVSKKVAGNFTVKPRSDMPHLVKDLKPIEKENGASGKDIVKKIP